MSETDRLRILNPYERATNPDAEQRGRGWDECAEAFWPILDRLQNELALYRASEPIAQRTIRENAELRRQLGRWAAWAEAMRRGVVGADGLPLSPEGARLAFAAILGQAWDESEGER